MVFSLKDLSRPTAPREVSSCVYDLTMLARVPPKDISVTKLAPVKPVFDLNCVDSVTTTTAKMATTKPSTNASHC